MNNLQILGTPQTPTIDFNAENNYFIISGRSVSENSDITYWPIVRYLELYKKEIDQINKLQNNINGIAATFRFKLVYYNSSSIRYLNTIMKRIEEISENNQVSVIWEVDSDDEYLIEMGETFAELFDINLQIIVNEIPQRKKITNKFKDVN